MGLFDRLTFAAKKNAQEQARPDAGLLASEIAVNDIVTFLTTIPDPDATLQRAGIPRHKLSVLESDDEIYGALETRRDAAISTPWHLEPNDSTEAKVVEEALKPVIDPLMRCAWKAVPYGYSVAEIVWKRDGSLIIPDRAGEKPLEWFEPQRDGSLKYFPESGGLGEIVDTRFKFLLTRRNPTYNNPFGEALLSRLYWAFYFRHNGLKFWAQFLERFGNPLILGKSANPKAMIEALQKIGIDAAISVGMNEEVEAVTQSGGGEFDLFESAMARRVQKIILGQTLTTDVGKTGSYAAAQVHNMVRMDKRAADLTLLMNAMQVVVDAVMALNFPGRPAPKFEMSDGRGLEPDRAKRDSELAKAGIVKFTKGYLMDRYDFKEGDIELPEGVAAVKPAGGEEPTGGAPAGGEGDDKPGDASTAHDPRHASPQGLFAAPGARFTPEQAAVERISDGLMAAQLQPIDPRLVRDAVMKASTPEDLADRLAALLPGVTGSRFAAVLERALFAADIMGFVHAAEQAGAERLLEARTAATAPRKSMRLVRDEATGQVFAEVTRETAEGTETKIVRFEPGEDGEVRATEVQA